ncbi:MAG TPA: 1-deoxy-D-xylulose-5-phosphate reductoisomerase [Acidimicrobiales bacterium]|nr:1-deoxy-D-xylulose-5-phosphate reductoisomerase [Acidimicrobiales bacterium]
MTSVSVVGSTGSIGTQTLDVVRTDPDRYRVIALGAARSVDALAAQASEFRPLVVAIADEDLAAEVKARVPTGTEVRAGAQALASIATDADVVVNGVVGFAGLGVTIAALASGRRLALANKESLIAGGPAVRTVRSTPGAEIVPVDSEHCAIHQCLRAGRPEEVARLVLTASGGPFRGRSRAELANVTLEEALAHPTWTMGPKITVDSSTLMNKGLEVIEAHELFGPTAPGSVVTFDRIDVVVHPQSVIHSMVEWTDGATIAQLSRPDMRLAIGYALAYPARLGLPFGAIDWSALATLTFERPDVDAFPCLPLAYEAGRTGGTAPAWLNAANEVAVAAFLEGRIGWLAISAVISETLAGHDGDDGTSEDLIIEADRMARERATAVVARFSRAA